MDGTVDIAFIGHCSRKSIVSSCRMKVELDSSAINCRKAT